MILESHLKQSQGLVVSQQHFECSNFLELLNGEALDKYSYFITSLFLPLMTSY